MDQITFYELSARYFHKSDWTSHFLDIDKEEFQASPFMAYRSLDGEIELSTIKVSSKEVLRMLQKTLNNHWKIKKVLLFEPINNGYPKILKIGLLVNIRDNIRVTAYKLGAISDSSVYFEGREYWNFVFLRKESVEIMKKYMEKHGNLLDYKIREINSADILSKYEFRNLAIFTTRELEILKFAYERGFFENPKKVSMDDIAKELGISKAAIDQLLRKALKKIVESATKSTYIQ